MSPWGLGECAEATDSSAWARVCGSPGLSMQVSAVLRVCVWRISAPTCVCWGGSGSVCHCLCLFRSYQLFLCMCVWVSVLQGCGSVWCCHWLYLSICVVQLCARCHCVSISVCESGYPSRPLSLARIRRSCWG